jgi:hypothetical protein
MKIEIAIYLYITLIYYTTCRKFRDKNIKKCKTCRVPVRIICCVHLYYKKLWNFIQKEGNNDKK